MVSTCATSDAKCRRSQVPHDIAMDQNRVQTAAGAHSECKLTTHNPLQIAAQMVDI